MKKNFIKIQQKQQIKIYRRKVQKQKLEALFVSSQNTTSFVRLDSDPMKSTDQTSTDESFSANSIFHGRQSMPLTNLGRKLWHEGQRVSKLYFREETFSKKKGAEEEKHEDSLIIPDRNNTVKFSDCRKHRGTTRYAPLASRFRV